MPPLTTYRDACTTAHELSFRIDGDVVVAILDPGLTVPPGASRYTAEPRHVGARPREIGEPLTPGDPDRLIVAIVRQPRVGSAGGIESVYHAATADRCTFCEGSGYIVTLGGYRPCGRCGGTGLL